MLNPLLEDLNFGETWAAGYNNLASVHVYPQTYDELASQVSNLQKQVSDLQMQQWGFIFIAAYLTVTLGIVMLTSIKGEIRFAHKRICTQC